MRFHFKVPADSLSSPSFSFLSTVIHSPGKYPVINGLPLTGLEENCPINRLSVLQKAEKLLPCSTLPGIRIITPHLILFMNITEILKQYPEAATDKDHPAWQGISPGVFWWDEPLFGYYRTTDEWILRKHAEMLADAGVDVVFCDCYQRKHHLEKLLYQIAGGMGKGQAGWCENSPACFYSAVWRKYKFACFHV